MNGREIWPLLTVALIKCCSINLLFIVLFETENQLEPFFILRPLSQRKIKRGNYMLIEDALHAIERGQNHLISFTDLMEIEAAGEVAGQHFIQ